MIEKLIRHKQFLKDWNKTRLTDQQFSKFIQYLECLRLDGTLPAEAKDHKLSGEYKDCREFHLGGDVLIIYIPSNNNEVVLLRLGSHSQLFK